MSVLLTVSALLGAVIGVLTPRIVFRLSVEYGQPPRVGCAHCEHPFPPDLPGWVRPGARCPHCRHRLGPPTWLTTATGVLVFGLLAWALGPVAVLPGFLAVAGIGVPLAFIDLACLRLPDPLVGAAAVLGGSVLLLVSLLDWSFGALGRAALAGLLSLVLYLVIALIPGSNLGLGDVKLAGVLGLMLGWLGWPAVILGLVLPHLINGPIALVLLLSGRAGRGSSLPLGPALLAGALGAVLVALRVLPVSLG